MSKKPDKSEKTDDADVAPSFIPFLTGQRKGQTAAELAIHLQEIVKAVRETGRPGKLTLELTVKRPAGDSDMVEVNDKIKVTVPSLPRSSSLYFVTDQHGLSRKDPRQEEMLLGPRAVASS